MQSPSESSNVGVPSVHLGSHHDEARADYDARLADVGDNINNASHPIRWIRNYRGDPNRDFEMGSDAMWNLGQSIAGQDPPEAGVLPMNLILPV